MDGLRSGPSMLPCHVDSALQGGGEVTEGQSQHQGQGAELSWAWMRSQALWGSSPLSDSGPRGGGCVGAPNDSPANNLFFPCAFGVSGGTLAQGTQMQLHRTGW